MKKGFTLIELLAVIIVLSVIVLITMPIVTTTIKNAKKGSAETSAENYIRAVELTISNLKLNRKHVYDGIYTIDGDGNLIGDKLPNGKLEVDASGDKPTSGTIVIKGGGVSETGTRLVMGDYNIKYKDGKLAISEPYKGVLCKANTTKATALVWAGNADPSEESSYTREEVGLLASEATSKYDVGVTYTCEFGDGEQNTFYVLETSGDYISLIAGMNFGAPVAWVTKEDYLATGGTESDWNKGCELCGNTDLGPITANKTLKEKTSSWTKLDEDQVTLPTAYQVATAAGLTFDGSEELSNLPTWLDSYTKYTAGTRGYWTSTIYDLSVFQAWSVNFGKTLAYKSNGFVINANYYGVRPVITISKSNLS